MSPAAPWGGPAFSSVLYAEARTGRILGELSPAQASFTEGLNGAGQMDLTLPTWDPKRVELVPWQHLVVLTQEVDPAVLFCAVVTQRDGSRFGGPGVWDYLHHRYLDPTYVPKDLVFSATEQFDIVDGLLWQANRNPAAGGGLNYPALLPTASVRSPQNSGVLRDRSYTPGADSIGTLIEQLAACEQGFDFVTSTHFADDTRQHVATDLELYFPERSRDQPIGFDDDVGVTLDPMQRDASGTARRVYGIGEVPPGSPDGTIPPKTAADAGWDDAGGGYPLLEDVIAPQGVSDLPTLAEHVAGELAAVQAPSDILRATVDPGRHPLGAWRLGDHVYVTSTRQPDAEGWWTVVERILSVSETGRLTVGTSLATTAPPGHRPKARAVKAVRAVSSLTTRVKALEVRR